MAKLIGMKYKRPRLESAKGGYIVCYDKHMASGDSEYDDVRYVGEGKEVFTDGAKAIKRLDEISNMEEHKED
ncbi:MAG: hypothetical protein KAJ19_25800 [Gammaproteobacteria bacterium]|nr:hypothetical protein [Gammaproteobacteria bacterium]